MCQRALIPLFASQSRMLSHNMKPKTINMKPAKLGKAMTQKNAKGCLSPAPLAKFMPK